MKIAITTIITTAIVTLIMAAEIATAIMTITKATLIMAKKSGGLQKIDKHEQLKNHASFHFNIYRDL